MPLDILGTFSNGDKGSNIRDKINAVINRVNDIVDLSTGPTGPAGPSVVGPTGPAGSSGGSTGSVSVGDKNNILSGETVIVAENYQYLIFGDLAVGGSLSNSGEVCIVNGGLILGTGSTFDNSGTLNLVSTEPINKKYTGTFSTSAGVPLIITHGLRTLDLVYSAREGNNDIFPDFVRVDINNVQITTSLSVSGNLTIIAY